MERLRPAQLILTAPGDWRALQAIKAVAQANGLPLDIREDRHFFVTVREFVAHAKGRKSLRLEYFHREQRQRHAVRERAAAIRRGEIGADHHAVGHKGDRGLPAAALTNG